MEEAARTRKIIHVDMDAFFASVEQRDNAELRGRPVVVGGKPNSRGVVAAASYEARAFGVHSAMACSQAARLCPHAVFVPPRFDAYRDVSQQIMAIFREYTDLVEPLSLDEAFLDVTENKVENPSATWLAMLIRARIFAETSLTASAGVAPNKFLAKIASDMQKPNGLTVISPDRVAAVLADLPVRKIPGVGAVTEKRMKELGIETTADLRLFSDERLQELFGKSGQYFARLARGEDERPVVPHRERKSIGVEDTFSTDLTDRSLILEQLTRISAKTWERLGSRKAQTVTVKLTYEDFEKATRSQTLDYPVASAEQLLEVSVGLLEKTLAGDRPIRLLGVTLSHFTDEDHSLLRAIQLMFPFSKPQRERADP